MTPSPAAKRAPDEDEARLAVDPPTGNADGVTDDERSAEPPWAIEDDDLLAVLQRSLTQAYEAKCHLELRRARREIGPDVGSYTAGLSAEDAIRMLGSEPGSVNHT